MANDKSKKDKRDRVADDGDHEIRFFAKRNGIGIGQARDLMRQFGNNRETYERDARKSET